MKKYSKLYICVLILVFGAFTIVLDTFPRSEVSLLENRRLASFPEFSWKNLFNGQFTGGVSVWFSDSEPFRDDFMALSMRIKEAQTVQLDEENIVFHAASADEIPGVPDDDIEELELPAEATKEYENQITADADTKIGHKGIIVIGTGNETRAMSAFGAGTEGAGKMADVANMLHQRFGNGTTVYLMIVPTQVAYYCPDKVKSRTKPQHPCIQYAYSKLDPACKSVDVYPVLGAHADEDIYLRTDHHWAPLGGFYAAQEFARVARVPFKSLDSYDRHVVHGYVGSMYGYSGDISIKNNPEDFVYWIPRDATYNTTYITFKTEGTRVLSASAEREGPFFYKYKDGSGGAYCTFMGGDTKITKVRTGVKNGRRVCIIKDSYGNTLPGFLFYSFEEVHVLDYRYFDRNLVDYVHENKITDFLIAMGIFGSCGNVMPRFVAHCDRVGRIDYSAEQRKANEDAAAKAQAAAQATSNEQNAVVESPQQTEQQETKPVEQKADEVKPVEQATEQHVETTTSAETE